jgi:hypothetical protein
MLDRSNKMTGDELFDYVRKISSREDFVKFVEYLSNDHEKNILEWENNTLQDYLNGLASFTKDIGGYYENMGEIADINNITWRMAAEILLAGSTYGS